MNEGEMILNPKVRLTATRAGKSGFGEVDPKSIESVCVRERE